MPHHRHGAVAVTRALVLALASALLAGCPAADSTDPGEPDTTVAEVTLAAPHTTIEAGATVQVSASATNAAGDDLGSRTYAWTSDAGGVATVNESGLVTAVAPGSVQISAIESSSGIQGSIALTVVPAPVHTVSVAPTTASVVAGDTRPLEVVLKDSRGAVLSGRAVTWTSSDENVATVDGDGLVTAHVAGGPVTITATSEAKSGSAQITVTPVPVESVVVTPPTSTLIEGDTWLLTATVLAAGGDTLTDRTVSWTSSDTSIAPVDQTGLVTARIAGGPVTITATADGVAGSAQVTVTPMPVATVEVTPAAATLVLGEAAALEVIALGAGGDTLTGRTVVWASVDSTIAAVDANGVVTSTGVGGPVAVYATIEGRADTALVTVTPVPVAAVLVEPADATIEEGLSVQLGAHAHATNGDTLTGRAATWSSSDTTIATVDASGLVTGVAPGGPVTVTATIEGVSGSADVTIVPTPVAGIALSRAAAEVLIGDSLRLEAAALAADGDTLPGRTITWTSRDASVASVDSSGMVRAHALGAVWIVAGSEGVVDSAHVTIAHEPVSEVAIAPAAATLELGATVQLTAYALSASGDTLADRAVTWSSSNVTVATVEASGLVTAVGVGGPVVITAEVEGASGNADITVTAAQPGSIVIDADSLQLLVGDSARLSANAYGSTGQPMSDVAIVWTTRDPTIGTVDSTGLVHAIAAGETWIVASSAELADSTLLAVSIEPVVSIGFASETAATVVGDTVRLYAYALGAAGDTLADRVATWTSRDTAVASIDASGRATGIAPGTTWIVVEIEAVQDSVELTVGAAPAVSLVVSPASLDTYIGVGTALSVSIEDANGQPMAVVPAWTSLDPSIATVDSTGVVTGVGIGLAHVVVSFETLADTALVQVASPITRIEITPDSATLTSLGATQAYSAIAFDTADSPMSGVIFEWQSMNPLVATVSPRSGETTVATAIDGGITQIRASALGVTSEVALRVGQFAATIDAEPDSLILTVNGYATLTAEVRDGSGGLMDDAQPIWRASNGYVAVDSLSGTVRGAALGTSFVWAELDGVTSDSVAVTVSNVAPPSLAFGARTFEVGRDAYVSMPIYLSTAPTDSVVILLASSDTMRAKFEPTRVVVPAGQTQVNATLRGVSLGTISVSASDSAGTYGSDAVSVQVQNVATLRFLRMGYYGNYIPAMHVGETYEAELRLSDPAPAGGLYFTLSGAGVEFSPATLHVPAGQLVAGFELTGSYPATAIIGAQASGTTAAVITTNVVAAELQFYLPSSGGPGVYHIGRGQYSIGGTDLYLTTPTHVESPLEVTLSWADPSLVEAAPAVVLDITGVGQPGKDSEPIPFSAVATGSTLLTASAPGWTEGVATIVVTTPKFDLNADSISISTSTPIGYTYISSADSLGVAHPVANDEAFEIWSGDTTIVRVLTPDPVMPAGQQSYQSMQVEALRPGSAWVYSGGPGILTDSMKVTVTAPSIVIDRAEYVATPGYAGGVRVSTSDGSNPLLLMESSDTMVAAVNATHPMIVYGYTDIQIRSRMPGTATIVISADGYHADTLQVRTAPGFVSATTNPLVVFQTGQIWASVNDSAYIGGLTVLDTTRITFSVLDTTVAVMDSTIVDLAPGSGAATYLPIHGVRPGTTSIVVTAPNVLPDTVELTVTPASLTWLAYQSGLATYQGTWDGTGLQVRLPGPRDEDVVVRFTHGTSLIGLAVDSAVIPAGETGYTLGWESFGSTGSDTVVVSADGYASASQAVEVVLPRIIPGFFQPGDQRTTMPPTPVQLALGAVGHGNSLGNTTVPVTIRVESTDSSVFVPDSGAIHFQPGEYYRSVPVRFVGPGQARLIFTDSAGIYAADSSAITNVVAPRIEVASTWPNYYTGSTGFLRLGMEQMNGTLSSFSDAIVRLPDVVVGEDLVITLVSSDTGVVTVPATVTIPVGSSSAPFRVVALDTIGSIAIYANATGLLQGRMNVDVVEPALRMGVNPSYTMFAPDDPIHVQVTTTNEVGNDNPPAQDLVLTVTSSDPSVIAVESGTITIPAGSESFYEPILRMVGAGTATITITDPRTGFVDYGVVSRTITVSVP